MDTVASHDREKLELVVDNTIGKTSSIFVQSHWKKLMVLGNEAREQDKKCLARFYFERANREAVSALTGFAEDPFIGAQELYDRASAHIIAAENLADIYLKTGDKQKVLSVLMQAFDRLLVLVQNRSYGMIYRQVLLECLTIMLDSMVVTMRSCGCCPHMIADVMERAGKTAFDISQES
ncbi:hypothetical protein [Emcibacter nanhaiensis]|uniref:Uncharacterized protein n=1 Tax=Emcibacter nanhaiensis TaxID=1505037 RepID=A0A501PGL9_9PROT|nr:hypothetical protein [Emcibacter nanhaiensis]TPD59207.1 hypothetical protein FIV46_13340 [Emcibacter nanhaiensis]